VKPENGDLDQPTRAFRLAAADPNQTLECGSPPGEGSEQDLHPTLADSSDFTLGAASPIYPPETSIGPYKLLQLLGEGGMGAVYQAQQEQPVHRTVALKVIKPGLNSAAIVNRFQAELQALAMMDHPHIATVFDAGLTETGLPYFVMEYVRGVPITNFCDQQRLTTEQRLELFLPICQAIQHAHQKGIMHRDIKPTNVLVAQTDRGPVPKVIDFGLARATEDQQTEGITQFGTVVGTLEYMSPEQAAGQGVDTRTDIYSLGVLLYELLAGHTPLEWNSLRKSGLVGMLKAIQHQDPPSPSTRFSAAVDSKQIAAARHSDPHRLRRQLRGELDWIVLKALERDRERRYGTANGFALDIQRYLDHEAVEACPPSVGYRLRKFSRRHWKFLAVTSLLMLSLIGGLAFSSWQAVRAIRAERAAVQARDEAAIEHARRLIEERRHLLEDGLRRSLGTLVAIAAAFETWPDLDRSEFSQFCQRCLLQNPEISSVTWVPRVPGNQRARIEAEVRTEGFADFQFTEFDPDGSFSGRSARLSAEYLPILFVEPLEPNRMILGMDSSNNLPRRRSLDQARDSGVMVASAPLLLGEERVGELGFLVFQPVYRSRTVPTDQDRRREELLGFAVAAFRIRDLVDRVLGELADEEVGLTIYDQENPEQPIYRSAIQSSMEPFYQQSEELEIAGRRWRLEFVTCPKNDP
jgi:serine/threonine protein kinase